MKNILLIITAALVISCKTAPAVPVFSDIIGKEWKLVEIMSSADTAARRFSRGELAEIGMEQAYTLRFEEERLNGVGAPNRYSAPYESGAGQALSIKAVAGTLMASFREPESLKEREYFGYLENADKWDLAQGKLQLHTRNERGGEAVLIFETE
jgi:heat shock protein HslJ